MKVIILSGVSGSGKSTLAQKFSSESAGTSIFSADSYFMKGGVYNFDPSKLGEAHGQCLKSFAKELEFPLWDTIIVDNTNTTVLELAPYVALAQAYGYSVEIHTIKVPEGGPMVDCCERNVHSVPPHAIEAMAKRLEKRHLDIPFHWQEKFGVTFVNHEFR